MAGEWIGLVEIHIAQARSMRATPCPAGGELQLSRRQAGTPPLKPPGLGSIAKTTSPLVSTQYSFAPSLFSGVRLVGFAQLVAGPGIEIQPKEFLELANP